MLLIYGHVLVTKSSKCRLSIRLIETYYEDEVCLQVMLLKVVGDER